MWDTYWKTNVWRKSSLILLKTRSDCLVDTMVSFPLRELNVQIRNLTFETSHIDIIKIKKKNWVQFYRWAAFVNKRA